MHEQRQGLLCLVQWCTLEHAFRKFIQPSFIPPRPFILRGRIFALSSKRRSQFTQHTTLALGEVDASPTLVSTARDLRRELQQITMFLGGATGDNASQQLVKLRRQPPATVRLHPASNVSLAVHSLCLLMDYWWIEACTLSEQQAITAATSPPGSRASHNVAATLTLSIKINQSNWLLLYSRIYSHHNLFGLRDSAAAARGERPLGAPGLFGGWLTTSHSLHRRARLGSWSLARLKFFYLSFDWFFHDNNFAEITQSTVDSTRSAIGPKIDRSDLSILHDPWTNP
jgi:hypothetical protein